MRKLLKSMKTLLIAAGLLVGTNSTWGETYLNTMTGTLQSGDFQVNRSKVITIAKGENLTYTFVNTSVGSAIFNNWVVEARDVTTTYCCNLRGDAHPGGEHSGVTAGAGYWTWDDNKSKLSGSYTGSKWSDIDGTAASWVSAYSGVTVTLDINYSNDGTTLTMTHSATVNNSAYTGTYTVSGFEGNNINVFLSNEYATQTITKVVYTDASSNSTTYTSVYSNDFSTSSDWTANGKSDGWRVNPGTTTANTFASQVIGNGSGSGDMGLVSPSMSINSEVSMVDVSMKFKMDGCVSGKSSGIEFITSDVNVNNGYVSSGTPFFAIGATASGNGYWGTITVGGNDHTSTLNQTGTFENNALNRNTTGIVTLYVRFNFSTKTATYTLYNSAGTELVAATTVSLANLNATTLDRIFLHAGKTYGGVTIDDVEVCTVESEVTTTYYRATFTEGNSLTPSVTIYSDSERETEIANGLLEDGKTYYYTATLTGYNDYTGSFTVESADPTVEFTMTAKPTFTYTKRAVCGSEVLNPTLATGTAYEGETVTLTWSKYIKVGEQWYVTSSKTFQASATQAATEDIEYAPSNIAYFFEMEKLTRSGGVYLTETSDTYSNYSRLRFSKGSQYYTSALAGGVYSISIPWENGNTTENEVYVYTRATDGTLSGVLLTFKAPKGSGTFTGVVTVPEGYSIAFNGNEESGANNNARMDYMTLTQIVPATVTTAGWATLYTDYALDFSGVEGLKAYTAMLSESTVTLTEVSDVPANTGVVLKATETLNENKTYNIPVIASSETAKGDLKGSTTEAKTATTESPIYILKMNGNQAQFMRATTGSLAAGKAYLEIASGNQGAKALNVVFANDPTGIANVNAAEATLPVKRIVNGQLVIEKNGKRYNAAGAEL